MNGIEILSFGHGLADNNITNHMLCDIVDTSDEWIRSRTGISCRNFVKNETNTSMATTAAKEAIEKAGISLDAIGICIVATLSSDNIMPSTACCVAENLSLSENILCFDLNSACTGFIYALNTAACLLGSMKNKYALVIGSEVLSKHLNMNDRSTCVLFGDGAGAVIIKNNDKNSFAFLSGYLPNNNSLSCLSPENLITMDGPAVFRFAAMAVPKAINQILSENSISIDDIDTIVCHQANKRIIEHAAKKLNIDISKFFMNLQYFGNTSAASIPLALYQLNPKKGDKILCVGFGGGLTYGAALVTI